ncbi:hypothetical protein [Actinomadura sp. DC4]|uniref:hypothetical protein n=1 Tax=Actinomadura sp. DC4 TaxID=3055069 RepID=UPI0025B23C65|nr:hypothetical protein [Actinomadura sp. DC4]MDN3354381.1 hypothetical protein [Actinomadura sp. DC4]
METKVSIIVLVDAVGALSDRTLHNGNLSLMDDGKLGSRGQGTTGLCTIVRPGQVIQWTPIGIDVQAPVEIRNITFLGPEGRAAAPAAETGGAEPSGLPENLDRVVWSGVVPAYLTPGVPYRYRLEVQIHEGANSVMHIDSPALMCA